MGGGRKGGFVKQEEGGEDLWRFLGGVGEGGCK